MTTTRPNLEDPRNVSQEKKNLRKVEDSAVRDRLFDDAQGAHFPREDLGAEETGLDDLPTRGG